MRIALALASALAALTLAPAALADVVMPPPKTCPPGHTPVTSHAGPRCVANAPTSCPVGWTGILGGQCVLSLCDPGREGTCPDGAECKAQDLCGEERLVEWGWGAGPAPRGNELGAPPRHFDPPRHDFFYDDVCNAGSCAAGRTCYPTGVCLPRGVARAAKKPANGGPQRGFPPKNAKASDDGDAGRIAKPPPSAAPTAAPTDAPVAAAEDAAPPVAPVEPRHSRAYNPSPRSGGCSGCDGSSHPVGMLGLSAGVALVLTRSRGKKRTGDDGDREGR